VHAPADRIFDLLTDPTKHPLIDGSGTVLAARGEQPERLELGSTFGMSMRLGLPYFITNKVVEYERGRLIAWRHFAGHRWRWELNPVDDRTTEVTESFDWSRTPSERVYRLLGFLDRNTKGIEASLKRLADLVAE
jgi:uncharacterized protein YndB with AHSA1/START domain